MTLLIRSSHASSTRSTYSIGANSFLQFAALYGRLHPDGSPIPASEETLMLFAAYLTFSLSPQSIKVYLYTVRNLHVENGLPNPLTNCLQLRRLLHGIKRTYSVQTNQGAAQNNFICTRYHSNLMQ